MRTDYYIRAVSTVKRALRRIATEEERTTISGVSFRKYSELRDIRCPPKPSRFGEEYVSIANFNFPRWVLTKEGEKKLERGDRDGRKKHDDSNEGSLQR
jgi:hypothetical protein